jgi:hypothetical protein
MSTKDPNLKVIIGAETKDFDKGAKSVKQGLKDLGSDAKAFGGAIQTLAGKGTAAFAAVAAAVVGTIKVIKDLSQQNQALGDAWEQTCAAMTGAFDSFKTAVANMDFTHLFSNMREAGRLAKELYNAQDGLGEVQTSYNMSLARQQQTINQLRLDMDDLSKTDEQRIEAGQKLLKIYSDLEKNPTRALSNISDASLDVVANKLGYSLKGLSPTELDKTRKYVENFFIWLGTEAGESWNSAYAAAFKDPAKLYQTTVNAQNAGLSDSYRAMLWNYQGAVGDKDRLAMEEAVVAYYNQEAKLSDETFKIRKQIQSIQNSGAQADATAAASASKKAEAEWKKQQELLKKVEEVHKKWATISEAGAITGGASPALPGVTAPQMTILPQVDAEYWKETITAQLGDFTIGIGFEADTEKIQNITREVKALTESAIVRTSEILGDLIGTLAGGGDAWGDFKNAALSAFGDLAIAVGKIAIAAGLASEGIQAALKMGNPYVAIAAGAALVALGTAVKSSLSAVASGDYSAGGGGYSASDYSSGGRGDYETREVKVYVTGTLEADGDKLITVINNTNKKNYYTQ